MEPCPTLAWVLLLSLITDWLKTVHSRDFIATDIIYLHPSTTPYPGARYCFTSHRMDSRGESVSVTKRCVPLEDCLSTGCAALGPEGHKVCTSCCEGNICNMPLPRNETDAIFATTSPLNRTPRLVHNPLGLFSISCYSLIVLWLP